MSKSNAFSVLVWLLSLAFVFGGLDLLHAQVPQGGMGAEIDRKRQRALRAQQRAIDKLDVDAWMSRAMMVYGLQVDADGRGVLEPVAGGHAAEVTVKKKIGTVGAHEKRGHFRVAFKGKKRDMTFVVTTSRGNMGNRCGLGALADEPRVLIGVFLVEDGAFCDVRVDTRADGGG